MPVESRVADTAGWLAVHPDARDWLERHRLDTPRAIMELRGEIVGGHIDRHVVEASIGGRTVFLKREHRVPWMERLRNARDGYGFCSKSSRECQSLDELQALGLPVPEWLACGSDGRGRAFLLLDGCEDFEPLENFRHADAAFKKKLAVELGRVVGVFHAAGYSTPDLQGKHVLVHRDSGELRILDWQRAGRGGKDFIRPLVQLWRTCEAKPDFVLAFRQGYSESNPGADGRLFRKILGEARRTRPSAVAARSAHRLVWLDGEAVVALPEVSGVLKPDQYRSILYPEMPSRDSTLRLGAFEARLVCETRSAWLPARFHRHGRPKLECLAQARLLFHLQLHGLPAPRVLAFGHRWESAFSARGFLLCEPSELPGDPDGPASLLKRLHNAGCVVESFDGDPFEFDPIHGAWHIVRADAIRYVKRVDPLRVERDRIELARHSLPLREPA